jgi:hypothetical protein
MGWFSLAGLVRVTTGRHEAPDNNKEIEMLKDKVLDLLERAGWTFVQTFFATLLLTGVLDSETVDIEAWKVALVASLISAVKSVIAQQFGTGTAATLPVKVEPVYPGDADQSWDIVSEEDVVSYEEIEQEPDA